MNPRRLYRSRRDRQLAGVAGGMADYLEVDPTIVRILWIISVFFGGFTILLYILLAFIVPQEPVIMTAGPRPAGDAAPGSAGGTEPGIPADAAGFVDDPTQAQWTAYQGWNVSGAQPSVERRGSGRAGLAFGIVLVVFGTIALLGPLFPSWVTAVALGPALILALGIALVVVSVRRPTAES